jgi:transposase
MSDIARDKRGHAVMVRTGKSDLSVDDRYHVVMAVKDGKAAGKKVADVLKDLGVNKNSYARYVKRLKEVGHLQSFKKGRVGAKRKK